MEIKFALINDNKTRKKIKKEKQSLKTVPIRHIKEFLKTKGLIEVGSSAPEDILRHYMKMQN